MIYSLMITHFLQKEFTLIHHLKGSKQLRSELKMSSRSTPSSFRRRRFMQKSCDSTDSSTCSGNLFEILTPSLSLINHTLMIYFWEMVFSNHHEKMLLINGRPIAFHAKTHFFMWQSEPQNDNSWIYLHQLMAPLRYLKRAFNNWDMNYFLNKSY